MQFIVRQVLNWDLLVDVIPNNGDVDVSAHKSVVSARTSIAVEGSTWTSCCHERADVPTLAASLHLCELGHSIVDLVIECLSDLSTRAYKQFRFPPIAVLTQSHID